MAANTRGATRRRDESEDQGTVGPGASETPPDDQSDAPGVEARARGAEAQHDPAPLSAEEEDEEFEDEEDELQRYAELAQDQLEERLTRVRTQVTRKRKERELVLLRKELRGDPESAAGVLCDPQAKRRRLSDDDDETRLIKRSNRPTEPLYYHGKNIRELEEFLIFWVIHWEAYPKEPEVSRVRTAAKYLRGPVMKLWGQRLLSQATPIKEWNEFKQWLRDTLKAPNQRILESTLALKEMRQRENQTSKELYVYMCELENNIPTMTEEQRRAWVLVNGLRPALRSRVIRDLQTIDNVDAVLACAGRNESTVMHENPPRGARSERPGGSSVKAEAESADSSRFTRGTGANRQARGRPFRRGDAQARQGRFGTSRSTVGCWTCGAEDHIREDCPDRSEAKKE